MVGHNQNNKIASKILESRAIAPIIFPFLEIKLDRVGPTRMCVCYVTSVMFDSLETLWTVVHWASYLWNYPGMNTGMGCYALL